MTKLYLIRCIGCGKEISVKPIYKKPHHCCKCGNTEKMYVTCPLCKTNIPYSDDMVRIEDMAESSWLFGNVYVFSMFGLLVSLLLSIIWLGSFELLVVLPSVAAGALYGHYRNKKDKKLQDIFKK